MNIKEKIVEILDFPLALICMFGTLFGAAWLWLKIFDDPTTAAVLSFITMFFAAPTLHTLIMIGLESVTEVET